MRNPSVVEIVTFKLKAGVHESDFLQAADAVQSNLQAMSGYLNRELFKDEQGNWIDLVHWQSMEQAHAAAETLMTIPEAGPFIGMIDETSMTMRHLNLTRSYSVE